MSAGLLTEEAECERDTTHRSHQRLPFGASATARCPPRPSPTGASVCPGAGTTAALGLARDQPSLAASCVCWRRALCPPLCHPDKHLSCRLSA